MKIKTQHYFKSININKIIFLFLCFIGIFSTKNSLSQSLEWPSYIEHSSLSTNPNDRIASYDIVQDKQGNVLICGGYSGSQDFDPGPGESSYTSGNKGNTVNIYDIFIAKYNTTGDLLWVITAGDNSDDNTAKSLDVDAIGNVYVTGKFEGTVDFDPSPAVNSLTATSGDGDMFIAKYSPNGDYLWAMVIQGSSNFRQSGYDLDVNDAAGNFVIGARFDDATDIDPMNPSNNPSLSTGGEDAGIVVYDLNGNFIYGFNFYDASGGGWVAVEMDDDGNVFAFLSGYSLVDLDPGPGTAGQFGPFGAIIKFDPSGNYLWHKSISGSVSTGSIELDQCGNILISGNISSGASSSYDFGDGDPAGLYSGDGSQKAVFVSKYTNEGNFIWLNVGTNGGTGTTRCGSIGVNGYYNGGMALDKDGKVYLTGSTNADLTFGSFQINGNGSYRGYIVIMDQNGVYLSTSEVLPAAWALTWMMNIDVGDDYHINLFGKSSNDVNAPYSGQASNITAQHAYTYHIQQTIVPPNPIIEFNSQAICSIDTVHFSIQNETPDSVFWNFGDPSSGLLNDAFGLSVDHYYSAIGTYDVQAIAYFGCIPDTLDTIIAITMNTTPLNIGPDTTICINETLLLDATMTGSINPPTYEWNDISTNPELTVLTSGSYSVQVNLDGCILQDTIVVTVIPIPDAGLDMTFDLCYINGDDFGLNQLLNGNSSLGIWEDINVPNSGFLNTTTDNLENLMDTNGTLNFQYIVGLDTQCSSDTALCEIILNQQPFAGTDTNYTVCNEQNTPLNLNSLLAVNTVGVWEEITPTSQFNPLSGELITAGLNAGLYTYLFKVNGIGACVNDIDTALITVTKIIQNAGSDMTLDLCYQNGNSYDLNTLLNGNNTIGIWEDSENPVLSSLNTTTGSLENLTTENGTFNLYYIVGVGTECPSDTAFCQVNLNLEPFAGSDNSITLCNGDNTILDLNNLLDISASGEWNETIPTNQFDVTNGTLITQGLNAGVYTYSFKVIGSGACLGEFDEAEITINMLHQELAGNDVDVIFCEDTQDINVQSLITGSTTTNGNWSELNSSGNLQGILFNAPASFEPYLLNYIVNPNTQCSDTARIQITIDYLPTINLIEELTLCADTIYLLYTDIEGSDNLLWNNGNTSSSILIQTDYTQVNQIHQHIVSATNSCGIIYDTVKIKVVDCSIYFYAPNAFTPDGDGFNDKFNVSLLGADTQSFELQIFNRWGELMYLSYNPDIGWDGTYNGTVVTDDVYIWRATYKNNYNDSRHEKTGHVTIIK